MLGIRQYKGIAIDLWQGDITKFYCDAIVNAANSELKGGGGVDGAIHSAGGPSILEECKRIGRCEPGSAVFTGPGDLPCDHVIHTVGPIWNDGEHDEPKVLKSAYLSSLNLGHQLGCRHLSFAAISCGVYGYPLKEASQVAMDAIKDYIEQNYKESKVKRITIVLFSLDLYQIFQGTLFATFPESE